MYFSDGANSKLSTITKLKDGIGKEHEDYLVNLKKQIDNFISKLEKIKTLSGFQFEEGEKVSEKLQSYILELEFFSELNSNKMKKDIEPINLSIRKIIQKAGILQGKINRQRKKIQDLIRRHENKVANVVKTFF